MSAPSISVGTPRWYFHPSVPTVGILWLALAVALVMSLRGWNSLPAWVVLALAAGYSISGSP